MFILHQLLLFLLLAFVFPTTSAYRESTCEASEGPSPPGPPKQYDFAARPTETRTPPGATRSVSDSGNQYAVLAPENRVYGSPPPGWQGPATAAAVVTPALGAHFAMYIVEAASGAMLPRPTTFDGCLAGLERFLFVLTGELHVTRASRLDGVDAAKTTLRGGGFLYVAPGDKNVRDVAPGASGAVLIQIDRTYSGRPASGPTPTSVCGETSEVPEEVLDGEVFRLQRLLNASDPAYDFNIHIMTFHPGEYLAIKERHYNQHGLLMLEGQGMYMLGSEYMPVQAGDVIWMAPFVPQWFAALGKGISSYFLYKDTNLDPLLHMAAPLT